VTGAATVILAMGAGRKAATAIHEYLQQGAAEGGASEKRIKEAASSDTATSATRPDARVDDPEAEEKYRRGFGDGISWATDYATEGELRELVENSELGQGGDLDMDHPLMRNNQDTDIETVSHRDNPYWQGFIKGAEEVWSTR